MPVGHGYAEADEELLRDLEKEGLIRNLKISPEKVAFDFKDETVRFWLRDIGAVLELQVFCAGHKKPSADAYAGSGAGDRGRGME